jgi:hypothetical protein
MNVLAPSAFLAAGFLIASFHPAPVAPQDEMKAMMEKAKAWTQPGEHHKQMERFLGKWDIEVRMFMGDQASPPEKGTAEVRWLMDGRWLESNWSGQMMGMPVRGHNLFGYDNFKMSYVMTMVSSFDTAMTHAEGDMTPDGKSLILYGTLDEYLTGEHDKMVKYAYRFISPDEMRLEIHDLPIGEVNAKVVEITYKRAK